MTEKKTVQVLLLLLFAVMTTLSLFSEGSGYGGGDSNMHMFISKFSFKHHELFLHHWGKPFFILVSSPFAQFGFLGMNIFNTICALSTAYLMYLLAKKFSFKNSWLVIFMSLFAPVYFVVIFSGLTEIFFGFILVFSIFLFVEKKYFLSSITLSFLPFIRSEGYLLLPLFAFVLLYRKKISAVPWLVTGTIVYSLIGLIYFHDFFWLAHQDPYTSGKNIYGNGSLFFFLSQNEFIFGTALVVLILTGLISLFVKKKEEGIFFNEIRIEESLLLYGSFVIYFVAHSIFWWKGWFGSDGLIRVMAAVTPLLALLALRGANAVLSVKNSVIIKAVFLILIIAIPFRQHTFPEHLDYEESTLHQADTWIQRENLSSAKIFYAHPFVVYELNKDPFDKNSAVEFYALNPETPEISVAPGELVIWDSHFGPNEGRIPLQKLEGNKNFKMLNSFLSAIVVTPGNKERFRVVVFRRI